MSDYLPERAVILARISDARNGDTHGVDNQVRRLRDKTDQLGWKVGPDDTHVIIENDTSAFKRYATCPACMQRVRDCGCPPDPKRRSVPRTWRPGFRAALELLRTGEADGLMTLDLDRAMRDPRDLEDLLDVVKDRRPDIAVDSVTGSLHDLHTSAGAQTARILVGIAYKSSEDTQRRVRDHRQTRALAGLPGGGVRPYGWSGADMTTLVEAEAAEVRRWADRVLAGDSLRSITADLLERGVPTVKGKPWDRGTVRDILMKPANAGLVVYDVAGEAKRYRKRGERPPYDCGVQRGVKGQWPPILDEDTWRAVAAKLSVEARVTSHGSTPKWLLSMLGTCGECGELVVINGSSKGHGKSYVCRGPENHLRRAAVPVDQFITDLIVARLSQPDAASLFTPPGVDVDALTREAKVLRARKANILALVADDTYTAAEAREQAQPINKRLAEIDAALAKSGPSPLAGLPVGTDRVRAAWDRLPLGSKRAIIRLLMDVRLDRGRKGRQPGGGYFDAESIVVTWRQ